MAVAAKELGLPKAKYVLGIPLAARAKNPYTSIGGGRA